jgi:hypothetical protein
MSIRVPLTFRIYRGDQLVREQTLTQGVIKIGKVASAHLQLDDDSVSRMHAILEIDHAGTVHVIDLGSTRGTFVNGQRVNKAKLESGDSIKLGEMRVELIKGAPLANDQAPAVSLPVLAPVLAPAPVVQPPPVPAPAVRAWAVPPPVVPAPAVPALAVRPSTVPSAASFYDATPVSVDEPGAKAIEIAAMLGDSVVGVKHCIDPKSGKVSRKTWAMAIAGLACLLVSGIAFYMSVRTAAYNKGALDAWVRIAHKPAYAYRPVTLSAGFDWLAFGGFALGLLTTAGALSRMRNEKRSPYFRIGTAPGVELPLENAPTASFPLVAPSGDDFVFNYGHGIDGEMILDGRTTPLAELAATGRARPSLVTAGAIEVPIPAHAKIRARAGQTTFMVSAVAQPRRHVTPLLAGLESRTLSYFAGSLAVHLGIWALLQTIPVDAGSANVDMAMVETTGITSTTTEHEDVPPPKDNDTEIGGGKEGMGKAMALDEGAAGTTKSPNVDSHMRMKDNGLPPQLARQQALDDARRAGILGDASAFASAFASIDSTQEISSGLDGANVWGAMVGAEGEGQGYFGYGRTGFGVGGGCAQPPCGIIGSGPYGTIGTGLHAGDGWGGPGHGGGHMRGHTGSVPPPVLGQPTGGGDLDKSIIRRYIKRNLAKISYCYEHELLAHPGLGGEILVQFFITPAGNVTGAKGSGFDDTVAQCVAGVIGNIEFPRPANGGGVQVNYPFTFRAPAP